MTCRKFILNGRFDSLNKLIGASNHNRYVGAGIKKRNMTLIVRQLQSYPKELLSKLPNDCSYTFRWHRSDRREDPDNIASSVKYIFDAFQEVNLIDNDGRDEILEIHHYFDPERCPKGEDFVEIEIEEMKKND